MRPVAVLLCLSMMMNAPQVAASPTAEEAQEADTLKKKADDAFDGKRYGDALELYRSAFEKGKNSLLHYNIGQALTFLERYPEALASYQRFLAEVPAGKLSEAQTSALFARLEDLKAKIARVEVKCSVVGARVLVRDKVVGTVPLGAAVSVNAGPAKIEVLAEGHKPFVTQVSLDGGTTHTLDVKLERVDFTGTILVASNVSGASVYVDGTARGTTPLTLKVERGTHLVKVTASDHLDGSDTVTLEAGQKKDVWLPLRRAPDYTVAYFGFAVGALGVGAGAITGILALTNFKDAKANCDTVAKECGPAGQESLRLSRSYGLWSTVSFAVGIAGAGLGVFGLVRAARGSSDPAEKHARTGVDVAIVPGGLVLGGAF